MKSRLSLLVLVLVPLACSTPKADYPVVDLVPAESLATVMPASLDTFQVLLDTTYRGHFESEEGNFTLVTVSRMFGNTNQPLATINLSSFDDREKFLATFGDLAVRDTMAELETYTVYLGRVVFAGDRQAFDIKVIESVDSLGVEEALRQIDMERLGAFEAVPTSVDALFARIDAQPDTTD